MNLSNNQENPRGAAKASILQRVARAERAAVEECLDTYGGTIWALAKKHCRSVEEAESAVARIFREILTCAARHDAAECTEEKYVLRLAFRYLLKNSAKTAH